MWDFLLSPFFCYWLWGWASAEWMVFKHQLPKRLNFTWWHHRFQHWNSREKSIIDDLKKALESWNNKSTSELKALYCEFNDHPDFLSSLITLARNNDLENGSTWLLKHYLEDHGASDRSFPFQDYSVCFSTLDHWEARLHAFQSLDHFPKEYLNRKDLIPVLREGIKNKNKFLRAWSYYGFALLATVHEELRQEAIAIVEQAKSSETAGSVKARLKRASKLLDQECLK